MRQADGVQSFVLPFLPALAGRWLDNLTVTELSPRHLCLGHLLTGCAASFRDTPPLRSQKARESDYPTKEGTS
jgi:hypothetical protein